MAASALLAASNKGLALALFFICLIVLSFSDGLGGIPWMDLVARTIPAERRAGLFGTMQTYGGIAAFGAGFLVRYILDLNGIYPYNYVAVLGLGALGLYGSLISMHFIKEPPGKAPARATPMSEYLRRLPGAWRASALSETHLPEYSWAACTSLYHSSRSMPRMTSAFRLLAGLFVSARWWGRSPEGASGIPRRQLRSLLDCEASIRHGFRHGSLALAARLPISQERLFWPTLSIPSFISVWEAPGRHLERIHQLHHGHFSRERPRDVYRPLQHHRGSSHALDHSGRLDPHMEQLHLSLRARGRHRRDGLRSSMEHARLARV